MECTGESHTADAGARLGYALPLVNSCGGRNWEMQDDGLIAVEGEAVPPTFSPGQPQFEQLVQSWKNWRSDIASAAKRHGVPVSWVLAILTMETGLWSDDPAEQRQKVSPAGAIGLMQIMPDTARGFGREPGEMTTASKNIDVGAALLGKLSRLRSGELPEMAAAYNSGQVCDPGRNPWNLYTAPGYVDNVIRWNNTALLYLDLTAPRLWLGAAIAASGIGAALYLSGYRVPKHRLLRKVLA